MCAKKKADRVDFNEVATRKTTIARIEQRGNEFRSVTESNVRSYTSKVSKLVAISHATISVHIVSHLLLPRPVLPLYTIIVLSNFFAAGKFLSFVRSTHSTRTLLYYRSLFHVCVTVYRVFRPRGEKHIDSTLDAVPYVEGCSLENVAKCDSSNVCIRNNKSTLIRCGAINSSNEN